MAIRNISQVTCSLNLGLIYNLSYAYSPDTGCSITVVFVNQQGVYNRPRYMEKAQIKIGNASFNMYVVASEIQLAPNRRVMEVTFVDETFQLTWYYVTLTGKGCGYNVYQLGKPVDNRTPQQKREAALDPTAQQIADFTTLPDIEYSFNDFISTLRRKFSVQINATYDQTLTNTFVGTFREVLDRWCGFYNLAWFVENSIIKVYDPTKLTINLPTQPAGAIEFNSSEDVRDTYGKTVCNWFEQGGGEYSLNQTSDNNGSLLVKSANLYPIENRQTPAQKAMPLDQVTAAQFGQEFWFLYNYYKGTTAQYCGWTPLGVVAGNPSIQTSANNVGALLASYNETIYNQQFEAFSEYGKNIAGQYYMSDEYGGLSVEEGYQWFSEAQGPVVSFTNADSRAISPSFLVPAAASTLDQAVNIIPGTQINQFYSGVNYFGSRIVYQATTPNTTSFALNDPNQALVASTFETIGPLPGSNAADYSQLANVYGYDNTYLAYRNVHINSSSPLGNLLDSVQSLTTGFLPAYPIIPIVGMSKVDYATLKAQQSEQPGIEIVNDDSAGTVVANTAVIKARKDGANVVYYNTYSQCGSAHATSPSYFGHQFDMRQISNDNQIGISFSKNSSNVYTLTRDYATINALVNNPVLPQLAQGRSFLTKRVSYTVNSFDNVPTQFLTNGLVGLSLSIGDAGVTATYSYSNEVLAVKSYENQFARFEQMIRNSWIRQYTPQTVIS